MKDMFYYLLERKVLSISTSTLRIMFHSVLLGGPNARRGVRIYQRIWTGGGPYPLTNLDRESIAAGRFGPGCPNLRRVQVR